MTSSAAPATDRSAAQDVLALLAGESAVLRDDQWRAIEALLAGQRVLVVQRTGWGKSAVYFTATALMRARGAGPTLIVSPLLALMRNQLEAASRAGIRAETINSANLDEWSRVEQAVEAGEVDVLLISPERLNSPGFRETVLPHVAHRCGLLVVDEAHCISDWGHDFRPDYRRVRDVLDQLPAGVAVLATTATANERVTRDVAAVLGEPLVLRGSLDRESLALDVVDLPGDPERLAWLDALLAEAPGSGIIYTLTVAGAQDTAAFLAGRGHAVAAYTGRTDDAERRRIEAELAANELKAVDRHQRARDGLRQARPDVRRASRQPVQSHRLLPAGRPRRPGDRARRGLPAADPGGFGDLVLLRLRLDARRADGPPAARAAG